MERTIFASDLDNTLLFSWKHAVETDVCVELLKGAPQGYLTQNAQGYLRRITAEMLFIPVTSRSIEQYRRIQFPEGCRPRYAVTTNGAILLADGEVDPLWLQESEEAVRPWREALEETLAALQDQAMAKRCRIVDGMYTFAACETAEDAQALWEAMEGRTALERQVSGRKVYFFPPPVNKGSALERLRRRFPAERVLCAGDSEMDVPMLREADLAIVPDEALMAGVPCKQQAVWDGAERFYDFVLRTVAGYTGAAGE